MTTPLLTLPPPAPQGEDRGLPTAVALALVLGVLQRTEETVFTLTRPRQLPDICPRTSGEGGQLRGRDTVPVPPSFISLARVPPGGRGFWCWIPPGIFVPWGLTSPRMS